MDLLAPLQASATRSCLYSLCVTQNADLASCLAHACMLQISPHHQKPQRRVEHVQGLTYVYPEDKKIGCVEITGRDLMTLEAEEFVNDTVMDYRSMQIRDEYRKRFQNNETTVKIHFFSAFFHKKLTEKGKHTRAEVQHWRENAMISCRFRMLQDRFLT